ncbi:phosphoenolpyruvate:glucose-phosphotransferase regulator domain protein, partial [Bordetella bronchiseptica B18-5 (C3)]
WLLASKNINGAHGLEITDFMRLSVAAQAALPVLNLSPTLYEGWDEIIIYPAGFSIQRDPHGFRPASCEARADCSFAPPEPATCRGPRSALPRFFRAPCQARRGCALRHPAPANCRGPAAGSR